MLTKLMEQLNQINEKIEKRQKELTDLKEKRRATENKIFMAVMSENNLEITDVVEIIKAFGNIETAQEQKITENINSA